MKLSKSIFLLFLFFATNIYSKDRCEKEDFYYTCDQSFSYVRLGGFSFLHIPFGLEGAVGYRGREGQWGFGPLFNISVSPACLPALSVKLEGLYYPRSWRGGYFGVMPGVGIAHANYLYSSGRSWEFCPTFEVVLGKEFIKSSGRREFYYISLAPYLTISFNYGWGF